MMFYEHGLAMVNGKDVEYEDEEPPPLEGYFIRSDGARVISR